MKIIRWKAYEGEGIPTGIEGEDWAKDILSETLLVPLEVKILKDNSPEAIAIRGRLQGNTVITRLTDIKCKECESFMERYPLQPHPKANKLGWKFHYICSNNDCLYEYYTKEDI